jgi:hypothetical protein
LQEYTSYLATDFDTCGPINNSTLLHKPAKEAGLKYTHLHILSANLKDEKDCYFDVSTH